MEDNQNQQHPKNETSETTDNRDKMKEIPIYEYRGTFWKHPYMIYLILTVILFIVLLLITFLAVNNGLIPKM